MGNWNRRYLPRKKYNGSDYLVPPFPHTPHHTQSYTPGRHTNSVPSWEIDFCKSHGVAWHRVVNAKKYIYCYDNIVKWNDFAGEEAFNNSKKRYHARNFGLPSDNPLPDPDLYIDDVDWNSYIDPKLISDLDQEFFNPDEVGKNEKLDTALKEVSSCSPVRNDKDAHGDNPWESNCVLGAGIVKNTTQNWGRLDPPIKLKTFENPWEQNCPQLDNSLVNNAWKGSGDDKNARGDNPWESNCVLGAGIVRCTTQNWGGLDPPIKLKTFDNPWEQSCPQLDNSLVNNAWKGSGDGSWDLNRGQKNTGHCRDICDNPHNLWTRGSQNVESMRTEGWGHVEHNSWSSNKRKTDDCESSYPNNRSNHWGNNNFRGKGAPNGRRGKDWRNVSQGWKHLDSTNNESSYMDFKGQSRDGRAMYSGCRKREGPVQHASRYKSQRFQANDNGTTYQGWS